MLIAFNKPFGVLCQFSGPAPNLAAHIALPNVYPAGRLDKASEGLLLLTDDGALQHRIAHPKSETSKVYWVQLEGQPDADLISALCTGTTLKDGPARPKSARLLETTADQQAIARLGPHPGNLPEHRANNSLWCEIRMTSGRNRIVRRLCAALGYPVLRLVRVRIGAIALDDLVPGEYREVQWS